MYTYRVEIFIEASPNIGWATLVDGFETREQAEEWADLICGFDYLVVENAQGSRV